MTIFFSNNSLSNPSTVETRFREMHFDEARDWIEITGAVALIALSVALFPSAELGIALGGIKFMTDVIYQIFFEIVIYPYCEITREQLPQTSRVSGAFAYVIAPITEEWVCRGVHQKAITLAAQSILGTSWGIHAPLYVGIFGSAAIFGYLHTLPEAPRVYNFFHFSRTFAGGIAYSLINQKTGLAGSCIAHMYNNTLCGIVTAANKLFFR